ncbi:MAG: NADH-quinone oxidoreductase subunit M [Bacteroidetes bacterium]|nr:NADH-quinone oxidoreductase subunit M [Bacteroidota bacterium]
MMTLLLIVLPLLGALSLFVMKGDSIKKTAFAISLVTFAMAIGAWINFDASNLSQYAFKQDWIPSLGISFSVNLDGLSLLMVLLTTFLTPLIILSTFDREYKNPLAFYALILTMEMALIGVFVTQDAFLFYIFWELALIPIYFISLLWGGENARPITFKFFLYTLAGSLLMLFAIIYLYLQTPEHSFAIEAFHKVILAPETQSWIFWMLFIAFAIKIPVFPFHTWQPSTYHMNSTPGTMLLSGIMLKMGIFGLMRWLLPVVPQGCIDNADYVVILATIGIVYASAIAIVQKDFKKLLAYSSIAHVGLITAGVFSFTDNGLRGASMQMLAHGVNVVGLFFVADILFNRTKTFEMKDMGGIRSKAPWFATLFLIILLGSVALPLTNGFVGEFLLLLGVYEYSNVIAAFCGLTIILGAVYMLMSYQKTMLGETSAATKDFTDLTFNEKAVLIPIAIVIIATGLYPKPLIDLVEPSVQYILSFINI